MAKLKFTRSERVQNCNLIRIKPTGDSVQSLVRKNLIQDEKIFDLNKKDS